MHAIPENTILPQVIIKEFLKNDDSGIDFDDTDIDIKEKEKKNMIVSNAIEKMIDFYQGSQHDINHFLKVWSYARNIGLMEGLDDHTQEVLELTAVVHDISCPLCREKYGNANGKKQELESPPLVSEFFKDLPVAEEDVKRISWLVAHHHTYTGVDGIDYQILLEADYLVNAGESSYSRENVQHMLETVFQTESGIRLLKSIYLR